MIMNDAARELKASYGEITDKIKGLQHNLAALQKNNLLSQKQLLQYEVENVISENLTSLDEITIVNAQVSSMPVQSLMQMGDIVKEKLDSAVVVLATIYDEKPYFIVTLTRDLVSKGLHSGHLIKKIAGIAGGSGGGKPEMAQAGAREKGKISDALSATKDIVAEQLKGKNA